MTESDWKAATTDSVRRKIRLMLEDYEGDEVRIVLSIIIDQAAREMKRLLFKKYITGVLDLAKWNTLGRKI